MAKAQNELQFWHILDNKNSILKFQNNKIKIPIPHEPVEAKHREDQIKNEGAYTIWKKKLKGGRSTDGWTKGGSVWDKPFWLCQWRS